MLQNGLALNFSKGRSAYGVRPCTSAIRSCEGYLWSYGTQVGQLVGTGSNLRQVLACPLPRLAGLCDKRLVSQRSVTFPLSTVLASAAYHWLAR